MLFIFVIAMTIGAPSGIAPPARPLPAPRGMTCLSCFSAIFMMACTSSVVSGKQTGPAIPPSKTDSSLEYSIRSSKFSKTRSSSSAF